MHLLSTSSLVVPTKPSRSAEKGRESDLANIRVCAGAHTHTHKARTHGRWKGDEAGEDQETTDGATTASDS